MAGEYVPAQEMTPESAAAARVEMRMAQLEVELAALRQQTAGMGGGDDGLTPYYPAPASPFKGLFDLYDLTTTTVKVRGKTIGPWFDGVPVLRLGYLAGVPVQIVPGASGEDLDADITVGVNGLLYLKLDRANNAISLESGWLYTMPTGGAGWEPFPLWFVPTLGGEILYQEIMDLRWMPHVTAMA